MKVDRAKNVRVVVSLLLFLVSARRYFYSSRRFLSSTRRNASSFRRYTVSTLASFPEFDSSYIPFDLSADLFGSSFCRVCAVSSFRYGVLSFRLVDFGRL